MIPESAEQILWDNGSPILVSPDSYSLIDFKVDVKNLNSLSKKEKQIIYLLSQKYRQKEIAEMLKVSKQMISKYIRQIRKKLSAAELMNA